MDCDGLVRMWSIRVYWWSIIDCLIAHPSKQSQHVMVSWIFHLWEFIYDLSSTYLPFIISPSTIHHLLINCSSSTHYTMYLRTITLFEVGKQSIISLRLYHLCNLKCVLVCVYNCWWHHGCWILPNDEPSWVPQRRFPSSKEWLRFLQTQDKNNWKHVKKLDDPQNWLLTMLMEGDNPHLIIHITPVITPHI